MKIDIITLFPDFFQSPLNVSIIKRALNKGIVTINIYNLRDYSKDNYKSVDDTPYGGGAGMVLRPDLIFEAVESINGFKEAKKILTCPKGTLFNQKKALELSSLNHLIIICGHYEGVDERVALYLADERISIGDYILSGGEVAALVMIDAIVRLIPGVLGNSESTLDESFMSGLLEYPHYTRPYDYKGYKVPDILLSGNHQEIDKWRKEQMLITTKKYRPDLIK